MDRGKAKPIDKVLAEEHKDGGGGGSPHHDDDVIVWPTPCSTVQVAVQQQQDQQQQQQEEEDLLGYGTAEPTTSQNHHHHRHHARPRRSSLSNKNDAKRLSHRRASIGYSGEMTLTLPTKNTVTKRRSITFSDDDVTIESGVSVVTAGDNDNDDEKEEQPEPAVDTRQLWFHQEEYRHIEEKVRAIVRNSKRNNQDDRPTWQEEEEDDNNKVTTTTLRGLEGVMDTSLAEERTNVIRSVLEDQASQREMGVFDEEMIASTYQYNSMDAQLIAVDRAKQDEKDIQGYLETTRRIHDIHQLHRRMSC